MQETCRDSAHCSYNSSKVFLQLTIEYSLINMLFLKFFLQVPVSNRVWVYQRSTKGHYAVGDTAILQCNITSDEIIKKCEMAWVIPDPTEEGMIIDVQDVEKYKNRVNIESTNTFTSMTLINLTIYDTDKLICTAEVLTHTEVELGFGNGSILHISEKIESEGMFKNYILIFPKLNVL